VLFVKVGRLTVSDARLLLQRDLPKEPTMSTSEDELTIRRIHEIYEDVVRYGMNPDPVLGASDAEIDAMAASQGVSHVPTAIREIFRLIGESRGPYLGGGGRLSTRSLDGDQKEIALEYLEERPDEEPSLVDPKNLLVIFSHGGYLACVVDGAELSAPNPPVWLLLEDGEREKRWPTATDWFSVASNEVKSLADTLAEMRSLGNEPAWAEYFR
jgi:hypothetical protein